MQTKEINHFIQFSVEGLGIINGGIKALADFKTVVISDCGSDNEDYSEDKD